MESSRGSTELTLAREGSYGSVRSFLIIAHATTRLTSVRADGKAIAFRYDDQSRDATFAIPASATRVTIARRGARELVRTGALKELVATENVLAYRRGRAVVTLNNHTRPAEVRLPPSPSVRWR